MKFEIQMKKLSSPESESYKVVFLFLVIQGYYQNLRLSC